MATVSDAIDVVVSKYAISFCVPDGALAPATHTGFAPDPWVLRKYPEVPAGKLTQFVPLKYRISPCASVVITTSDRLSKEPEVADTRSLCVVGSAYKVTGVTPSAFDTASKVGT